MLCIDTDRHTIFMAKKIGDLLQRHFLRQEPGRASMAKRSWSPVGTLNPQQFHSPVYDLRDTAHAHWAIRRMQGNDRKLTLAIWPTKLQVFLECQFERTENWKALQFVILGSSYSEGSRFPVDVP